MKRNSQHALILTPDEYLALGWLVAVRQLEEVDAWLSWEDRTVTTCIGWDDLDGHDCPHWQMPTHGCLLPEGHPGTAHRCKCGATHRERSRRTKEDAA